MDNRQGEFKKISNELFEEKIKEENPMVFRKGEVLEIRGSKLKIQSIYKNKMTLKLLPQFKGQQL